MEKNIVQLFELYPLEYNFSVFLYIGVFIVAFFVLGFVSYRLLSKIKLPSTKKQIGIDFNNPKETAYVITFMTYKYDTPYNQELIKRLEQYKYRKKVEPLDEETKELIKKFLEYVKNV